MSMSNCHGKISADRMKITGGGEVVRFDGNVVMNIDISDAAGSRAAPEPARARAPAKTRATRQVLQREMNSMKLFSEIPRRRIARARLRPASHCADRCRRRQSAKHGDRRAECDAGFSQNRDQPIQIEAASLEMRDKKKEATFSGNVKVVQGDTTMTSKVLVVFYESSRAGARHRPPPAKAGANPRRSSPRPRARAAVRRSSGWRRKATWS